MSHLVWFETRETEKIKNQDSRNAAGNLKERADFLGVGNDLSVTGSSSAATSYFLKRSLRRDNAN
jgi:hypothetical protein